MLKAGSCLDFPILTHNTGAVVGRVGNTLIDPFSNRVAAFIVQWLPPGEIYVVPWSGVKAVTPDKLLIWASTMVVRADELFSVRQLLRHGAIGPGTLFKTADGQTLGAMSDFYFDERNGAIIGYEVLGDGSPGGKTRPTFLPTPKPMAVDMSSHVGQVWFRSYSRSSEKRECVSDLTRTLHGMIHQLDNRDPFPERMLASWLVEQTIGCPVEHTITTHDGYLVAVQDQIVTEGEVRYAQEKHSEVELLAAVGFDLNAHLSTSLAGADPEEGE